VKSKVYYAIPFVIFFVVFVSTQCIRKTNPGQLTQNSRKDDSAETVNELVGQERISKEILPLQIEEDLTGFSALVIEKYRSTPSQSTEVQSTEVQTTEVFYTRQFFGFSSELLKRLNHEKKSTTTISPKFLDQESEDRERHLELRNLLKEIGPQGVQQMRDLGQIVCKEVQNKWLEMISEKVRFTLEQYKQRRGWSDAFRESLRVTALKFAMASTYISAFQSVSASETESAAPKLVATLRVIRAPFGLRIERDASNGRSIMQHYGMWGPIVRSLAAGPKAQLLPKVKDLSQLVDPVYYALSQSETLRTLTDHVDNESKAKVFSDWGNSPVLLLPMESEKLGLGVRLPRPAELEIEPKWITQDETLISLVRNANLSYSPTSGTTVYWGAGEILEPGNFAVLSDFHAQSYIRVLAHLLAFVMNDQWSIPQTLRSRMLYTYNDIPRLYTPLGFKPLEGQAPVTKNGTKWTILRATPGEFLQGFSKKAEQFLKQQGNTPAQGDDLKALIENYSNALNPGLTLPPK
jgi:hypothetical protein